MAENYVLVDLGYGDSGKGACADWLCRTQPVGVVVRYNGGAQAAHNVVTPDGRQHTFSQWGSGTLAGVPTFLSRYMMVDPFRMSREAEHLIELGVEDPWGLVWIDREALLTTPYHREANRERERRRGDGRHGSCGVGIGETMAYSLAHPDDAPRVGDCRDPLVLRRRLTRLQDHYVDELGEGFPNLVVDDLVEGYEMFAKWALLADSTWLKKYLSACSLAVFEGAQGVLLDEWYGFHPYTTWSTCTTANAETLLREAGQTDWARLGLLRTSTTRHGAGPLVTDDAALSTILPEAHNTMGEWQGPWRVGHFDAVAHRYAIRVNRGVDGLVVSHLDAVRPEMKMCTSYSTPGGGLVEELPKGDHNRPDHLLMQEGLTESLFRVQPVYQDVFGEWEDAIGEALGQKVLATAHGPSAWDRRWARTLVPTLRRFAS